MERPTGYATIGMLFAIAKKMALRYGVTNIQDIQLDSQNNGIKFILTNGDTITVPFDASEMPFIPGSSGLTANNVQDAIYELNENKQDIINELNKLSSDLVDDTNSINKFVTSAEKSQITTNATDISNIKDGSNIDSFGDVETALSGKQDTLTAGNHIVISSSNVISTDINLATKLAPGLVYQWVENGVAYSWNVNPQDLNLTITTNQDGSQTYSFNTLNYTTEQNLDGSETVIFGGNE